MESFPKGSLDWEVKPLFTAPITTSLRVMLDQRIAELLSVEEIQKGRCSMGPGPPPKEQWLALNSYDFTTCRCWFQIFLYVHPYLRNISNFTNIFQIGWNHQLVLDMDQLGWFYQEQCPDDTGRPLLSIGDCSYPKLDLQTPYGSRVAQVCATWWHLVWKW